MEYRHLGRAGVKVSSLCLGCMNFGSRTEEDESIRMIHRAIDAGINFLDTSNSYGRGASETVVGKALAQDNRRENIVLATKVTSRMADDRPNEEGASRYTIMKHCEDSLRRLRTDHIDLYQLHWMDLDTPLTETLRALDDLVQQGKVRYIGCSKFAPARITEAMMLCRLHGWTGFVSEQPPYNILDRRIENQLMWTCRRFGIGLIPWAPIAAGILSGKYSKDESPPENARFNEMGDRLTPRAIDIADALKPMAQEKGCSLAELCLAWVRRQPGITAPIIGPRTMEHLASSLKAVDIQFTPEDLKRIDELSPPGTAVSNYWDKNVYFKLRKAVGIGCCE